MFNAIIAFSLRQRGFIALLVLALVGGGIWAFARLPIDAVPDITNNQVQILTQAPALSSLEVERFVTFPVEIALKSIPNVVELRSLSHPGLSVVTVVFEENVDIYFARQQILEKLREAEEQMPAGAGRPELAPVSTGLGEIFRYVVRDTTGTLSPMDLRIVQDWIVRRGLLGTPGIAEVNSLGGYAKQYHVLIDPDALVAYNLTLRDVFDAVAQTSGNAGAGYIETGPEQYSVRSVGLATGIDDLKSTVIRAGPAGTPITLADVATVQTGPALRFGSASENGTGEVVVGIAMQLKGANARVTVNAVKERIEQIRPSLPHGVVIEPYYDREDLVDRTIHTVVSNLIEGALLVIGVLLLFLANLRSGLILASVIPLAMMFAGIMMVLTGQSGNLMSLGAIDFGLVVDGSLIIVENCLRLLERRYGSGEPLSGTAMRDVIYQGSVEMRKSATFGVVIIIVVYLPILTLQGIEGKLFRPMALTVSYALIGALLLSLTYVPMMLSLLMKKKGTIRHSPLIIVLHRRYIPFLRGALNHRKAIAAATALLLAGTVLLFTRLGSEFIPRLDEGDISMTLIRLPSVSLTESQRLATRVEQEIVRFPEVKRVVSHTGRAEISTDPMGFEIADVFIMLKPREEWKSGRSKEELIEAISERLKNVPGIGVQFLQPIEMRFNELIAGAKGDVAVKVVGEDYDILSPTAQRIAAILRATPGGEDVTLEQTSGQPQLVVRPDRAAIARYGLTVETINEIVRTAIGGAKAGEVSEGEKRFDVVVRYRSDARNSADAIGNIMVAAPGGGRIPLSSLAHVGIEEGPAQVSREDGSRFVMVQANVRDRDIQSYMEEVQRRIAASVKLPAGYGIVYGGQFGNLQAASRRLAIVVPIALALIFLLLFQTFRSVRLGVMIFLCVPMSVIGGVAALAIGGLPFSISAGIGFIALFGIAVLNGIVMMAAIRKYQGEGMARRDAVLRGADERLRPVITTAALAGLGFLPMLLARGSGAEVQRPLATVIIGGLISSTFLTLVLLPIIYDRFGGRYVEGQEETPEESAREETRPARRTESGSAGGAALVLALLLGTVALAGAPSLRAQTVVTLESARRQALANGPELKRSDAAVQAHRAARSAIGILPNPEIFFTVDEAPSASLTGRSNTSLGIAQSFDLPPLYSARAEAAELEIRQSESERDAARRETLLRASQAYTDLVTARTLLDLADSAVALTEQFAQLTERRRALGESGALEPLQASVALANARRRQTLARGELRQAAAALGALMGIPHGEEITVRERLSPEAFTASLTDLEDRLRGDHPLLEARRLGVEAARAHERSVRLERLPSATLEYSRQTVAGSPGYFGGSIRLGVPLWRWFSDGPDRVARSETELRSAELARDSLHLLALLRARYASYQTARGAVAEYTEHLIPQATEGARIALRLFQEGSASYLEVLAAQSSLIETESGYIDALHQAERVRTELEYFVGGDLP
ncbi:MAG TPA: CusA/CzcA family heavy metal efflux RND transporter [Candidatus Kapabacteria bacterium]|nr:CusA/CzcA family heavy metal efflux RND transporter [Candidatus Kapabacteria bacterium]